MNNFNIASPYIVAIISAWLGAHIIKYVANKISKNGISFKVTLFNSGGMPSSHSATVAALATIIGFKDGFNSGLFGLAFLLAIIVMYDAMKVRRSTGEQGTAIRSLIKEQKSNIKIPYTAQGHILSEVIVGAIFGLFVGLVVFLATK